MATNGFAQSPKDATGLPRGDSRLLLRLVLVCCYLARNVNLHGARPWHPASLLNTISVATSARLHGTSPWHLWTFVQSRHQKYEIALGHGSGSDLVNDESRELFGNFAPS